MEQHSALGQIGSYCLLSKLGEGGMGSVFLAEDDRLDRQVAIKCLKIEQINANKLFDCPFKKRLRKEASMQAQLNHPHVVHVYDFVEDNGQIAIVMEYVEGQNLSYYMKENIVSLKQRVIWLLQIARGLSAAHAKGLIHRDLKPDNVLINPLKAAKITDFGIAKNQQADSHTQTISPFLMGSYSSLSPEQILGIPLDRRSDLFAFGILAFKLLCGSHPFDAVGNKHALVQNILNASPQKAKHLNPELPTELVTLLERLLEKDPDKRIQSAQLICPVLHKAVLQLNQDDHVGFVDETLVRYEPINTNNHFFMRNVFSISYKKILQKNYIYGLVGFLLIWMILVFGFFYWSSSTPSEKLFIAILPPSISSTLEITALQKEQIERVISTAFREYILQEELLYLISPKETWSISGRYHEIAKTLAADVLIETNLYCQHDFCEVIMNRLESTDVNEVINPWAIYSSEQWRFSDINDHTSLKQLTFSYASELLSDNQ